MNYNNYQDSKSRHWVDFQFDRIKFNFSDLNQLKILKFNFKLR